VLGETRARAGAILVTRTVRFEFACGNHIGLRYQIQSVSPATSGYTASRARVIAFHEA